MKKIILLSFLLLGIFSNILFGASNDLKEFISEGNVLGFADNYYVIASMERMLKVEMLGGNAEPEYSSKAKCPGNKDFDKVSYQNLWEGVDLVLEKEAGSILKSTYFAKSANLVENIHLRYNRNVEISKQGNLVISYENGQMRESRPVAWQVINGKRKYINAEYRQISNQEIGFNISDYDSNFPVVIDPSLTWYTFHGSTNYDGGYAIATDAAGNIYVAGYSQLLEWGSNVINHHSGQDRDICVVKLNSSGVYQWNTFLGGSGSDGANAIVLDAAGNIYVEGGSGASWGTNILNPFAGGSDICVVKLNSDGVYQWNTFIGGAGNDSSEEGIVLDDTGNIYIAGTSWASWGTNILSPYVGGTDYVLVKLNSSGVYQWNTFFGGPGNEYQRAVAIDGSNNIYIGGRTDVSWGTNIINPYVGGGANSICVTKVNSSGVYQWNTFFGGNLTYHELIDMTTDAANNIYFTGYSYGTWGTPISAFTSTGGLNDICVAKLASDGSLTWNTFLGGTGREEGYGIALDAVGDIYISGHAYADWGSNVVIDNYHSLCDMGLCKLSNNGVYQWNAFIGSNENEFGTDIAVDSEGFIVFTGWGGYYQWTGGINPNTGSATDFIIMKASNLSLPSITTTASSNVTEGSATSGGDVTSDGGDAVTARGICWNTGGTPTTADNKTTDGTGTGAFASNLTDLLPNTTYYVRAYATNTAGTGYGNEISFTTLDLSVSISTALKVSDTQYTFTSDITNPNTITILDKGIVWSTSQNPTTSANNGTVSSGAGSLQFTEDVTGLSVGPGYYVRAYITTSNGTFYSSQVNFGVVPTLPEWGLILLAGGFLVTGGWFMFRKFM